MTRSLFILPDGREIFSGFGAVRRYRRQFTRCSFLLQWGQAMSLTPILMIESAEIGTGLPLQIGEVDVCLDPGGFQDFYCCQCGIQPVAEGGTVF